MEKPEITGANLAACVEVIVVSLLGFIGGALGTYLACEVDSMDEIFGEASTALM